MRIWFALLVAPMLALADQSVSYAAAGWTCARANGFVGHGVHALFLAGTITAAVLGWRLWLETRVAAPDERTASRHFLAGVGIASAVLASAVIVAMWIPHWMLSPCG